MVTAEDKDMERSRVLVIGGTGHIGKHIVAASLCLGHPTAILFKEFAPSNQVKVQLLNGWLNSGACLLKMDATSAYRVNMKLATDCLLLHQKGLQPQNTC